MDLLSILFALMVMRHAPGPIPAPHHGQGCATHICLPNETL